MPPRPTTRSKAFAEYLRNQHEIVELLRSSPSDEEQLRNGKRRELANALFRGSVVLLSSHLERYLESLVVEAVDAINNAKPHVNSVPEVLRLVQVRQILRTAHEAEDIVKKSNSIRELVGTYAWFLDDTQPCEKLKGDVLISGFDNPLPRRVRELFRHLGIADVVGLAINMDTSQDRRMIEIKVQELVEKRNAIAHTGMTADLTRVDVTSYLRCTRKLVRCIDVVVGLEMQKIVGVWPWT